MYGDVGSLTTEASNLTHLLARNSWRPCRVFGPSREVCGRHQHLFRLISALNQNTPNLHFVRWSSPRSWCMLLLNSNIFGLLGIVMYYPRPRTFTIHIRASPYRLLYQLSLFFHLLLIWNSWYGKLMNLYTHIPFTIINC